MKYFQILLIVIIGASTLAQGESCGGLLESDGGEFGILPNDTIAPGQVCVWIVKLVSRQTIRFNLQELGQGLNVSLYGEHDPSESSLQPISLTSRDVGRDVDINGQTLIIALTQGGWDQGFSFSWDSLQSESPVTVTAANYIDRNSGQLSWNRFRNRERLTLSLNVDPWQSLDIEANANFRECDILSDCACSYVGVYEFRSDGSLREVSIACGRPSQVKVQHLYPNVLVFVYLNSTQAVSSTDYAQIKWESSPKPTQPPVTTTTPDYETIVRDCGGVFDVLSNEGSTIAYLPEGGYENNEHCVWTGVPRNGFDQFEVYIESYGIENRYDGITVVYWNATGTAVSRRILPGDYDLRLVFNGQYILIAFSSDGFNTGPGFVATISGLGQRDTIYTNQAFVFNETEGNFSYPIDAGGYYGYDNNERTSVAIQTPISTALQRVSVDFIDIQDDFITLYILYDYVSEQGLSFYGSGTGSNPGGVPNLETRSNMVRLFLFASNEETTGTGFGLSWST
jgi:hypothetical protein